MNKFIKFMLFVLCAVALLFLSAQGIKSIYPTKYKAEVMQFCRQYELPESLVYAVIKAESNFDPNAKSSKCALGLMQLVAPTGEWIYSMMDRPSFHADMLKDPRCNIELGCFYLSYLLDLYDGNKKCALAAYNAGQANVNNWRKDTRYSKNGIDLDVIPFPETQRYVNQVLTNQRIYQMLYD